MERRVEINFLHKDADSGLDNASDSSQSCGEEPTLTFSDYDELLNSDSDGDLEKSNATENIVYDSGEHRTSLTYSINEGSSRTFAKSLSFAEDVTARQKLNFGHHLYEPEMHEAIEFYERLKIGQSETVDFSVNSHTNMPVWLDEEKFKRGQKFARDHLFCINFAELLSLYTLFALNSSLRPLIFTGKSDSPFSAFNRYLNTTSKLLSWYRDDVWRDNGNLGRKNLSVVRGMHKSVYQRLTNCPEEDLSQKTTLGDPRTTALWCPLKNFILEDFRESIPPTNEYDFLNGTGRKVWISQADMSITQFGFVGLAVTYPKSFGIHSASDEDLEAFIHLWRGLGYLLGIKDEYNYCDGDLKTTQSRTKLFIEGMLKPAFRNVTCDWEHMCRCLSAGISFYLPQVNFESTLLYLCHTLRINTPRLKKQMTFRAYLVFQIHRFIFYLMKFRGVLPWLNSRLYVILEKAQNVSPDILNKWKEKEFSYTKQPGKCPINGR